MSAPTFLDAFADGIAAELTSPAALASADRANAAGRDALEAQGIPVTADTLAAGCVIALAISLSPDPHGTAMTMAATLALAVREARK